MATALLGKTSAKVCQSNEMTDDLLFASSSFFFSLPFEFYVNRSNSCVDEAAEVALRPTFSGRICSINVSGECSTVILGVNLCKNHCLICCIFCCR